MNKLLAASFTVDIETSGNVGKQWNFGDIGSLIQNLLLAAIIVSGLATFVYLIMGGIQFLTSSGEKAHMEAARGRITSAILGLTIVVASYAIIRIVETVLGISIVSGICWPGVGAGCAPPIPPPLLP